MLDTETVILSVCTDCTLAIAGYTDEESGRSLSASFAGIARIADDNHVPTCRVTLASIERGYVIDSDGEEVQGTSNEEYFSWAPCDVCLTNLGGDRLDHELLIF